MSNLMRFPALVFCLLTATVVAVGVAPQAAEAAAPTAKRPSRAGVPAVKKLAMVDMQRVLNETKAGKSSRKSLEASSKKKQQKLDKKRSKLESDFSKLKSLKGNQLAKGQEALQKESMELQSMLYALQNELQQQEGKLLEKMYRNAQKIVAKIAERQKLDLVLVRDAMTIIYTKDSLDITDQVIKLYNVRFPRN